MRIGYLLAEFPGLTHIIFWREIVRMRDLGDEVLVAAMRAPRYRSPHVFALERCQYLLPLTREAVLGIPSLDRALRQVGFAIGLRQGGLRERWHVITLIPASWTLARWIRRFGIEHLHVHSFSDSLYVAALAHIGAGISYSATLHGPIEDQGLNQGAKLQNAAFACATSGSTRRDIEAVAPGKCLDDDVPCGVDLEVFAYRNRVRDDVLRLISVGRLNAGKGILYALQAIASVRHRVALHYTLVGSGPDEAELGARVTELGLDDIVSFDGPRSEADVAEQLGRNDVAVLTSVGRFETTAIAVREAMATGMPVIMSRIGEAEQMIEPGITGLLVAQRDTTAIAEAILWFGRNRDRLNAMGRAAHEVARARFADSTGASVLHAAIRRAAVRYPAAEQVMRLPSEAAPGE